MWAIGGLLISNTSADFLFHYPHGDVFFNHLVQIVGHGNHAPLLGSEQLKLFSHRWGNPGANLRFALLASHEERTPGLSAEGKAQQGETREEEPCW